MAPSRVVVALALAAATRSCTGNYQFRGDNSVWERVLFCETTQNSFQNGYDYPLNVIREKALRATQVKICTGGSTSDCVTSRPGSFPIANLRQGITMLSHIDATTPCTYPGCVGSTWDGPANRLFQLQVMSGPHQNCVPGINRFNRTMIYWACGTGGLHATLVPTQRQCFWSATNQVDSIGVFINSDYTTAPTAAPTRMPSGWFQHAGHLSNWTQAQDRIVALEQTVRRLEGELSNYATLTSLDRYVEAQRVEVGAAVSALRIDVITQLEAVNATVDSLRTALRSAVTEAATRNPGELPLQPVIEAEGSALYLRSPGAVNVESSSCPTFDLCNVGTFSQRLSQVLQDL